MTQYAYFDPTVSPSPVIGWFDTVAKQYTNLPPAANLLELTDDQWAAHFSGFWQVVESTTLAAYNPAPVYTLPQQATIALAGTLTIVSTSTPAMNGPYAVDATTQSHIQSEISAIMLDATFADGTTTVVWPDMANPSVDHTFTVAEFTVFARAVGAYVAALYKVINGTLTALPSSSVIVA